MESMATFFKDENDPLYYKGFKKGFVEGLEEGREEWRKKVIGNLLEKLGLSDEQAADIMLVPL